MRCSVMAEDAAEQLVAGMRRNNPRIERAGAMLPESSSVAMLQFARLLRESGNPERRGFKDGNTLVSWLSEVLTPDETVPLRQFVG